MAGWGWVQNLKGGTVAFVLNCEGRRVGRAELMGQGDDPKLHNNSCTSQPFIKLIKFINFIKLINFITEGLQ